MSENSTEAEDWSTADSTEELVSRHEVPIYQQDKFFYRVVSVGLASTAFIALIGSLILAYFEKSIPEGVIALGSTAIGALAGVIVGNTR